MGQNLENSRNLSKPGLWGIYQTAPSPGPPPPGNRLKFPQPRLVDPDWQEVIKELPVTEEEHRSGTQTTPTITTSWIGQRQMV